MTVVELPRVKVPYTRQVSDGYLNMLSGIGVPGRDKGAVSTIFTITDMSQQQVDAAFRGDWIARKIITIPADDSTREWRSWQADAKDITALEETERKFRVQEKTRLAMMYGRGYGGGALVVGTDDSGDMMEPLNLDRVRKNSLQFLHAMPRWHLNCGPTILDLSSEWYGRPEYYEQRVASPGAPLLRLHPSRVVPFFGAERLDTLLDANAWSDSCLQSVVDAVKAAGLTPAVIAHLISEAKIDVINIPNLTEILSTADGEKNLTTRFASANAMKSVINAIILDENEKWQRLQLAFAGMPDIILVYLMIAAGAADIPATRFLSQSPKGLNATGESDIRNHYDKIRSDQVSRLQPAMSPLDEVLIRTTFSSRDPSIFYGWNSLWQMTEKEQAELALQKAQVFKIDNDSGLINPDVLRKARANQLVEDEVYPGLEDAIDEFDLEPDEVDEAALAAQQGLPAPQARRALPAPRPTDGVRVGDAEPMPLYVRRDLLPESVAEVRKWAKAQGLGEVIPDMHVTVLYSRAAVDWMSLGADDWGGEEGIVIPAGGPRVTSLMGAEGAVSIEFASSRLQWRHRQMVEAGASHDYPEYRPHVAVAMNPSADLDSVEPFRGALRFGPEIFEEIRD